MRLISSIKKESLYQFRLLLLNAIRMDFRESRKSGSRKRKMSPITWALIFYGFMGISMAVSLVPRTGPFYYTVFMFAYSMMMMAFMVIFEFNSSLFYMNDVDVIMHRPISSQTFLAVKICNLLFYVFIMGTALCFFPALIGLLLPGSGWSFTLLFFSGALLANIFMASAIILLYTWLMRILPIERFKDILAYVQIIISFFLILAYQMLPRAGFVNTIHLKPDSWYVNLFPPVWFAGTIQYILGSGEVMYRHQTLLAAGCTLILFVLAYRHIGSFYLKHVSAISNTGESETVRKKESGKVSGRRNHSIIQRILRHPDTKAGYEFGSIMLRRDRSLKMALYPVLGIPAAVILFRILEGRMNDPFVTSPFSDPSNASLMIPFFILFMVYLFITGIQYHSDWEAAWIYYTVPIKSPGNFLKGIKWSIFSRIMGPFYFVLAIVYGAQIPVMNSIKHVFSLLIFSTLAYSVFSIFIRQYPFSLKRERGQRIFKFTFLFEVLPFFGLTLLLQTVFYRNQTLWISGMIVLIVLVLISETLAEKRLNRVLGSLEYSDE